MSRPNVWIEAGVVLIYGESIDAKPHRHNALQIIWPKRQLDCLLDNLAVDEMHFINSKVEHQLQMDEGWVLLIEPKCELGQTLLSLVNEEPIKKLPAKVEVDFLMPSQIKDSSTLISKVLKRLNIQDQTTSPGKIASTDPRINRLVDELNQCLKNTCLKPAHWRASEVSSQFSLSESRFLHLFSQQMGISWRPYLLWRRIICAIQAILKGSSATDAAYMAGFSDSAHLSRTFRQTFGMTIRQAIKLFRE